MEAITTPTTMEARTTIVDPDTLATRAAVDRPVNPTAAASNDK